MDHDFEQGSLGDNYLLTMCAALASRGNIIPNIFHQKKYTHEGIFALKVFVKGRPEEVTVDDLFPIYNNQPAFAKPTTDGAWWLPILEKAFAKVHVNYEQISSGSHAEAAAFLTNSPSKEFDTRYQGQDELWSALSTALKQKFIVTTVSFVEKQGIQPGQGYIAEDVVQFATDENIVRLVKMRNPWKKTDGLGASTGRVEWVGAYSKNSKEWGTLDIK